MESTWNEEYYDIIDFFYWEPHRLGMQQSSKSPYNGINDVLEAIRRIEVPLNHQMNIFFRLTPDALLHELIWSFFGLENDDHFMFHGNNQWRKYATEHDPTQPDVFLSGNQSNVAIELKIKAKSDVTQVVKYLLLHYLNERFSSTQKQLFLLYLSPNGFSKLWKPAIESPEALDDLVTNYDFGRIQAKTRYLEDVIWPDVLAVWQRTHFSARSYSEFYEFLSAYREGVDLSYPSGQTLVKLVDGMMQELESRGLAGA